MITFEAILKLLVELDLLVNPLNYSAVQLYRGQFSPNVH